MKNITKIGLLLVVCTLLCISVVTATDNTNLPTKNEVNSFLKDMEEKSASEIMDSVKEDHSTWKADLLECSTCAGDKEAIALYYKDSGSQTGYGSIYFKEGEIVSPSNLKGYSLKEPYKGELDESGNDTVPSEDNDTEKDNTTEDDNENQIIKEDETESTSKNTYDAFTEALDEYDGKTDCTSLSCAQSLSDYFKEEGWDTEVNYCVAVDTSDEGTVYIVLGA